MGLRTMLQKHPKTQVYYFRKRVPPNLVEILGKKEFKKSLGTKDPKEASRLLKEEERRTDKLIEEATAKLSTTPQHSVHALTTSQAQEWAISWLEGRLGAFVEDYIQGRLKEERPYQSDEHLATDEYDPRTTIEIDLDEELSLSREALGEKNYRAIHGLIEDTSNNNALSLEKDSASYNLLGYELLKASIRYVEEAKKFLSAAAKGIYLI